MLRTFLALSLFFLGISASAAPRVVATILPIHSLAAGVMEGVAQPELLLPPGASPHNYALLPSDARRLAEADIVIWIGGELERFLQKPLQALASRAVVLEISALPGLTLLGTDGHDHGHEAGSYDPHLWLDPGNAIHIVDAVSQHLIELDPDNAEVYRNNAAKRTTQLHSLGQDLRKALEPVRTQPFLVFHDAYRYIEHRYGLNGAGALTLNLDRPPGARTISTARAKVEQLGVRCIFREPQFEPRLAEAVARGSDVRIGVLDPIGADVPPGPDAYAQLMWNIANSLVDCLSK